jgi:outer membrane receptor for ferrienterochelin and colicins
MRLKPVLLAAFMVCCGFLIVEAAKAESAAAPAPVPPADGTVVQPAPGEDAGNKNNKDEKKNDDKKKDDLDFLDKSLSDIRSTQTSSSAGTATDPIVQGVSRTAEKSSKAAGIVQVITADDIEKFGAKNLREVLQWATSVYMTGSYLFPGNVASIRGDALTHYDNHVLTLINGRPFRDNTFSGVSVDLFSAFPVDTISRVEIIRGPGSVLYGSDGFNGVINVITKDPDKPMLRVSALGGSNNWQQYRATVGNGSERQGALLGGDYNATSGWPYSMRDELGVQNTAPMGQDNTGVFGMYRNGDLTANLFVAQSDYDAQGTKPVWPADRSLHAVNSPRVFGDLGYLIKGDEQSLDLHFTYNFQQEVWGFPAPVNSFLLFNSNGYLWEAIYRRELNERMKVMFGAYADCHEGNGTFLQTGAADIPQYTETWYGVYAELDYQVNDWLKATGGMQGNLPGTVVGGISPRGGFVMSLTKEWTGKILYGQAFRSPYPAERFIYDPVLHGNPGLAPETIQTFDFQLDYRTEKFRFATTLFQSSYNNLITRVGANPATYQNMGTMEFEGVEFENEVRLSEHWRWFDSVTYQNNLRNHVANTTGQPIWMGKIGVVYTNDWGLSAALMEQYYGARSNLVTSQIVNPNAAAYNLASLNIRLDLNRYFERETRTRSEVQFLVDNLFNETYYDVEFMRRVINTIPAGSGRTFYGGYCLTF